MIKPEFLHVFLENAISRFLYFTFYSFTILLNPMPLHSILPSLWLCAKTEFFLSWELFWFLVVCIHLLHMARNESIFFGQEFCRVKSGIIVIRSVLSPVSLTWAQFGAGTIEPWADFYIHLVRFQLFESACVSVSGPGLKPQGTSPTR